MRLQPSPRWPSKLGVNTPCSTIWILETWTLSTSPPKRSSSKLLIIVHVCSTDAPGLRDCRKETSLHLLFCVADTVCPAKDKYTVQGYDMQFGANTLGHLLLIRKLYHLLASSTTPEHPARVVWTSLSVHSRCASPFNYDALRDTPARNQKYITPQTLYESSKFAIVQLSLFMSRTTFKDDGVLMIVVDPCVQAENSSSKNAATKFVG